MRVDRLRALLAERELDGAVISQRDNVRWVSGFAGSNGALIVPTGGEPTLVTDGRYVDQAAAQAPGFAIVKARDVLGEIAGRIAGAWAVETHDLSADDFARFTDVVSLERAVEGLRVVKDDAEIAAVGQACAISVDALAALIEQPVSGLTERQVARRLENLMFDRGAEALAFDTIVAAGENSAIPHHAPTDRVLAAGDLLKIDFGARVDGYHADCTRTFVIGPPDDFQREIHAAVREAQAAGVAAVQAASDMAEPWRAATGVLDAAGWLDHFTTGLGHGVGLAIHEDPYPGPNATGKLTAHTILTVEPGIYVPGRGGVRIEDTVLVTAGAPEVLTPFSTELLEIA